MELALTTRFLQPNVMVCIMLAGVDRTWFRATQQVLDSAPHRGVRLLSLPAIAIRYGSSCSLYMGMTRRPLSSSWTSSGNHYLRKLYGFTPHCRDQHEPPAAEGHHYRMCSDYSDNKYRQSSTSRTVVCTSEKKSYVAARLCLPVALSCLVAVLTQ